MSATEILRRPRELELQYDGAIPPGALELARVGDLGRYRTRRAAMQSKFYDRFAREAQRAIQGYRSAPALSGYGRALNRLAADLRAARRQGLTWLSRRNGGGGIMN